GVLSAAQVPPSATTQSFTVQVTDSANVAVTLPLTISVPIRITPASLPVALQSQANYSATLTAIGGSGVFTSWTFVGSLPLGLSLNSSTGLISGNLASTAMTQTFNVQVVDSTGATGNQQYTITVNGAVIVTTTSLPNGTVRSAYAQTLMATGGVPPYS